MEKYCTGCRKTLTTDHFQRRGETWRNPCRGCMAERRKVEQKPKTKAGFVKVPIHLEPEIQPLTTTKIVTNTPSVSLQDTFDTLLEKLGCHYNLTVARDKTAKLTSHGNPQKVYFAKSAQEVIDMVLNG